MTIDLARLPTSPAESQPALAAQPSLETLALLARRRSTPIALLGAPGPSQAEIDALIRLAARVPDHGKLGPWRFLVIAGAARERAGALLADLVAAREAGADDIRQAGERARFTRAPVVVTVISTAAPHPKIPEWEQVMSAGAVAFQLLLAAHAMGYAGAWLTEWPAYDADARAALGLAPHERIAGFVYLGAAKSEITERVRPDLAPRISHF
jgi:nitroreductase